MICYRTIILVFKISNGNNVKMIDDKNTKTVTLDSQKQLRDTDGSVIVPPSEWIFLPAGDAFVTRRVTAEKEYWRVQQQHGRRIISVGLWAPAEIIEKAKGDVADVRNDAAYQKKLESSRNRRINIEAEYEKSFKTAVVKYLDFAPVYNDLADKIADAVTKHAIPVGSGTVARSKKLTLESRAEHAVTAWLRHQATDYDHVKVPRIKGARRELRREMAKKNQRLLVRYRTGSPVEADCPLKKAIDMLNERVE